MMRTITQAAALPAAALAELKDWLGITTASEDAALAALLRTALEACEAFTGTMPLECTVESVLPADGGWHRLQAAPVRATLQVEGIDAAGGRFTLAEADYAIDLAADGAGLVRIVAPGPATRIAVRFVAGLASDWAALPDGLRHGAIRLAAANYRQREADPGGPAPPAAVTALWRPWRRRRL